MDAADRLGKIIRLLKKSLALSKPAMKAVAASFSLTLLASTAQAQSFKEKSKNESDTRKQQSEEWERNRLSDESVLKVKADFEMRLDENADLPDGIGWRKAYIYRNLMSKWFDSLIVKYHYDESMSTKIRSDWLSYMYFLESESKSSFLSFKTISANEKESYEQTAWLECKQYVAIEDGFAGNRQRSNRGTTTSERSTNWCVRSLRKKTYGTDWLFVCACVTSSI
jgi:hypothetical protein